MSRPKPLTKKDWRNKRLEAFRLDNSGYSRVFNMLLDSPVFNDILSKTQQLILIHSIRQVRSAPKDRKKRLKLKPETLYESNTLGWLANRGEFSLPNRYLHDRGITGDATISKARRTLVTWGFWDMIDDNQVWDEESGAVKPQKYRWSDRWLGYSLKLMHNPGFVSDYSGPMPGECKFPNIVKHNEVRKRKRATPSGVAVLSLVGAEGVS